MNKGILSLLSLLLVCMVVSFSRAQSTIPTEWDILGVKIGSTSDEAMAAIYSNVGVRLIPERGTLTRDDFTSPLLTFGATGIGDHDLEVISIAYAFESPNTVIGIYRRHIYKKPEMPSMESIERSLIKKYGNPDIIDKSLIRYGLSTYERNGDSNMVDRVGLNYYWIKNASNRYNNISNMSENEKKSAADSISTCIDSNLKMSTMMDASQIGGIDFNISRITDKSCGVNLRCSIVPDLTNPLLAAGFIFNMVDNIKANDSVTYIRTFMRDGAAATASREKIQGDQVKPKF